MGLDATTIGQLASRFSERFGDPTGTLKVVIASTITKPSGNGNLFHKRTSTERETYLFKEVRGSWTRQTQQNEEGMGNADFKDGECVFLHHKHRTTHAEIRDLLATEGAAIYWNDQRIEIDAPIEDVFQDATVFRFHRSEVT